MTDNVIAGETITVECQCGACLLKVKGSMAFPASLQKITFDCKECGGKVIIPLPSMRWKYKKAGDTDGPDNSK